MAVDPPFDEQPGDAAPAPSSPASSSDHGDESIATRSRSPITKLAAFAAANWRLTIALWVVVVATGLYAYGPGLAREGFPPVNLPIVVVDGTYFVDDAKSVDTDVVLKLQDAYSAIDGVEEVRSFSLSNAFAIIVQFDDEFSSPQGAALLETATTDAGLPPEAAPVVRPIDATKFLEVYDLLVSVTGPADATAADLEAEATKLADLLATGDDIERADVRNLLTEGVNAQTGDVEIRQTRFVRVAFAETGAYTDAIAVGLVRSPDSDLDLLGFSDEVKGLIDGETVLADGFQAAVTADFSNDIRYQISSLTGNLLTGLAAVAIVSLLLIGWRVSIITGLFMATVVMAALAGLWLLGYSLNTITLFGLILTLGLLVDDAIVISESIDANRDESDTAVGVVRAAINRVGTASMSGTLTTVLVFAPLLFVGGVLGEFIRAIPATVIVTLLLSFLFSILFIPGLAKPFVLKGTSPHNPVTRAEKAISRRLAALAEYPSNHGWKGAVVGAGVMVGALAVVTSSFLIAGTLGFNIFPPAADANAMFITTDFTPGTTIDDAQDLASEIDTIVVDTLGADLVQSQYITGNERQILTIVELTPFDDRDTKAPVYIAELEEQFAQVAGARISVRALSGGPPVEDYPFAAQIAVDDSTLAAGEALASELRRQLIGVELDKTTGEDTTIIDAIVSTEGQVYRLDGQRRLEVRAAFSTDDLTNNLEAAQTFVEDRYDDDALTAAGLPADAISFDFGQESDNQDDFASLGRALVIALALMLVLLVIQFRSIVQPLLIFLAIPFSFFGVFTALSLTGNPISFFVAVGFIALIGVVVNNTILLVDAANQARRQGMRPGPAIADAVRRRFRPLIATTFTTVVGLLPLALSNPFWEALSFTLIGGLISSTILVLAGFPVFYLAVEQVRTPLRNLVRRRLGRPLV